jgi:hypothetical protein
VWFLQIRLCHSDIRDPYILSNGKMVFTNLIPAEVIVLHKDGSIDFTIAIRPGRASDVTCIDSNTIAVSVKTTHQVEGSLISL